MGSKGKTNKLGYMFCLLVIVDPSDNVSSKVEIPM